jgi:hypothetical protein
LDGAYEWRSSWVWKTPHANSIFSKQIATRALSHLHSFHWSIALSEAKQK